MNNESPAAMAAIDPAAVGLIGGQPLKLEALALTPAGIQRKPIAIRVARFRIEFDCECGAPVALHQDHEQHKCGCDAVYRLDSVSHPVVQWVRLQRALVPVPPKAARKAARRKQKALLFQAHRVGTLGSRA